MAEVLAEAEAAAVEVAAEPLAVAVVERPAAAERLEAPAAARVRAAPWAARVRAAPGLAGLAVAVPRVARMVAPAAGREPWAAEAGPGLVRPERRPVPAGVLDRAGSVPVSKAAAGRTGSSAAADGAATVRGGSRPP